MVIDPEQPRRKEYARDRVLAWAENTLALLEQIESPESQAEVCCTQCGVPIVAFTGKRSGIFILRHPRNPCVPKGAWITGQQAVERYKDLKLCRTQTRKTESNGQAITAPETSPDSVPTLGFGDEPTETNPATT